MSAGAIFGAFFVLGLVAAGGIALVLARASKKQQPNGSPPAMDAVTRGRVDRRLRKGDPPADADEAALMLLRVSAWKREQNLRQTALGITAATCALTTIAGIAIGEPGIYVGAAPAAGIALLGLVVNKLFKTRVARAEALAKEALGRASTRGG